MVELLEKNIVQIGAFHLSIWNISKIILLIFFVQFILRILRKAFTRASKRSESSESRYNTLYLILRFVITLLTFFTCLDILGIKLTVFMAGGAALLVGIGFGLQNIFNDIISGLFLLIEGTIEVGDVVEVDGMVGKVKRLNLRNTQVIDRDDKIIIVPNHKFIKDNVRNWSEYKNKIRFTVKVGVAYGSPTDKVKALLLRAAQNEPRVLKNPRPFVRFQNFGTSSLDFEVFFWSEHVFRIEDVQSDLRFAIDKLFRENDITIAFPQRDIHIKSGVLK